MTADTRPTLEELLGNGKLDLALRLATRVGQSSGTIDPFAGLDRQELREWRDKVLAALEAHGRSQSGRTEGQ